MKFTYDKFLKILIEIIFEEEKTDYEYLEQVILRHAYSRGLVELKNDKFVLSKKGQDVLYGEI